MADELLTEIRGRTLLMTLNRPDAMNAFNPALAQALADACDQLDNDPDLSVGVLTGSHDRRTLESHGTIVCLDRAADLPAWLAER